MEEQKNNFKLSKVNWIFAIIVIGIGNAGYGIPPSPDRIEPLKTNTKA